MNVFKCHKCGNKSALEQEGESRVRECLVCQATFKPLRVHPEDFALLEAAFITRARLEKASAENALSDAMDRGEQQKKILISQN